MNRWAFRRRMGGPGPAVTPVIHALDLDQVAGNVRIAVAAGVAGVFLINHDFEKERLIPLIRAVRDRWPGLWLGVNFLAVTGRDAFPILGELEASGRPVDAYWADDAQIDERVDAQTEAEEIARIRADSGWTGLYFGGTAFKKQRPVDPSDYEVSAKIARGFMDVVATSGPATGREADAAKIADFRRGAGDAPLALASGVTPENASAYGAEVDCFLVATGISPPDNFYNIDPARLTALLTKTRAMGEQE